VTAAFKGFECIMIPGATKNTAIKSEAPNSICGKSAGLVTAAGGVANTKTICSK